MEYIEDQEHDIGPEELRWQFMRQQPMIIAIREQTKRAKQKRERPMPNPMTRDEAQAEARRRAEETTECHVVCASCLKNWYIVMSYTEMEANRTQNLVMYYAWPGEGE